MPVLMIPCTFIGSIALVLVPELSESYYKKQTEKVGKLVEKALHITLLIAAVLIPFYVACGEDIGILLYSNAQSGKMLSGCALVLLPLSITIISTSLLNSMNCERQTLLFFLLGSASMLLCVWFLPKYLGSGALLLGMASDYLITATCSLVLLRKKAGRLCSGKQLLKIALTAIPAAALGILVRNLLIMCVNYVAALAITALVVGVAELLLLWAWKLFNVFAFLRGFLARIFQKKRKKLPARS